MDRLTHLFLELLQVSLESRTQLSDYLSSEDWELLREEAERQGVLGILLKGVERLPEDQRPPRKPVLIQWIGQVYLIENLHKVYLRRSKELTSLLLDAGFDNCVLKGIAFARYYSIPQLRKCGDIDMWTLGRRKEVMSFLRSRYSINHVVWHNAGISIFNDVPVEVHFHPAWLYNPFSNYRLQRFFDSTFNERYLDHELGIYVMPIEFDAILALAHMFRHFLAEGIGLRHIIDYYYIVRRLRSTVDVNHTLQVIKSVGLCKFCSAVMWVLHEICGIPQELLLCESSEKEGFFLIKELFATGNSWHQSIGKRKKFISFRRYIVMGKHFPREVMWMIPWKVWHRGWMALNK